MLKALTAFFLGLAVNPVVFAADNQGLEKYKLGWTIQRSGNPNYILRGKIQFAMRLGHYLGGFLLISKMEGSFGEHGKHGEMDLRVDIPKEHFLHFSRNFDYREGKPKVFYEEYGRFARCVVLESHHLELSAKLLQQLIGSQGPCVTGDRWCVSISGVFDEIKQAMADSSVDGFAFDKMVLHSGQNQVTFKRTIEDDYVIDFKIWGPDVVAHSKHKNECRDLKHNYGPANDI